MTFTSTTSRLAGVALAGASGRLGSQITKACARQSVSMMILPRADRGDAPAALHGADVVVDASVAAAAGATIAAAREHRLPLVYCVSNPGEEVVADLTDLSAIVPVVVAANLSPVHWIQTRAAVDAAQRFAALGLPVEVTVHDRHPVTKRDAPSATARKLGALVGGSPELHSTRDGGPVSDHSVRFATRGESYELAHAVRDLSLVADGVLLLAGRLTQCAPGWYTTDDLYMQIATEVMSA